MSVYDSLKTPEEFKAYIEAQKTALVDASKRIKILEDENTALKQQVEQLSTEIAWDEKKDQYDPNISNSEMICLVEIEKLKHATATRPLTKDECQKLDTYHKILVQIQADKKKKTEDFSGKSDEELIQQLKLVSGGGSSEENK